MKTPSTKDTIGCANEVKQPDVPPCNLEYEAWYGRYEPRFLRWEHEDGTIITESYLPEWNGAWKDISKYFNYHSPNTYIRNKVVHNGGLPYTNARLVYINFEENEKGK